MDSYYILDEIKNNISKEIRNLDFDEDELNFKTESLHNIEKVKNKYNKSVDELIEYLDKITLEIDMVNNYDSVLSECKNNVIKSYENLKNSSLKLSDYRKNIASKIEKGIIKECKELDLDDTRFEIIFNEIIKH